eukprot:7215947-Alexandrium_andersonii.AAC.1
MAWVCCILRLLPSVMFAVLLSLLYLGCCSCVPCCARVHHCASQLGVPCEFTVGDIPMNLRPAHVDCSVLSPMTFRLAVCRQVARMSGDISVCINRCSSKLEIRQDTTCSSSGDFG